MKVIFIRDVGGVGKKDQIKDVAEGYAMNFLIHNGHAVQATADRIKKLNERLAVEKHAVEDRSKKALQGIERLRGANIRMLARANATGGLYREITADMIVTSITSAYGVHLPQAALQISEPIKKVGSHVIKINDQGHSTDIRVEVVKNGN